MQDSAAPLSFHRHFELTPGLADALSPLVTRVLAPNPSAMTFTGTVSYLVGRARPFVIDPGPANDAHLAALLAALDGRALAGILVTHSHVDHDGLTQRLAAATGAPVKRFGAGLEDGQILEGDDFQLAALHTPGHADDHMCFHLQPGNVLFSGDHVMSWSTSTVSRMGAFMASLSRIMALDPALLLPAHGPEKLQPQRFLSALLTHRRMREASILAAVQAGASSLAAVTLASYPGLDFKLERAAQASTRAHLEQLAERGQITISGALYLPCPIG
jgi:glyoxylase-like metal-dependent hydrolase (beta-lactamase superfamily II)